MRKTLLISLAVFITVVVGGFSIVWFTQASQIKKGVEQAIAKLNANQTYITYQSIETSGFPSDVNVTIVKPRFTGRIDTLLKSLVENTPTPTDPVAAAQVHPMIQSIQTLPEWNEDITLNGNIVLSINALSDQYSERIIGDVQESGKVGGQALAMTIHSDGDSLCTLQMQRGSTIWGALWNTPTQGRDGKSFLADLRQLDCYNPGSTYSDTNTHEKLVTQGLFRFFITHAPQGVNEQARLYVKSTDVAYTPAGDKLLATYFSALSPNQPFPPKLSRQGKQNMEIDISYAGPADLKKADKNPPIDFKISKFDFHNDVGGFNMVFGLSNATKDGKRAARLNFRQELDVGNQSDTVIQEGVRNLIANVYANPDPKLAHLQPAMQKYTQDELYSIVYPAIPNFHELNHLVQAVDVSYLGSPDAMAGDINLGALEFSATPYGITAQGSAKITQGHPIPAANVTVSCRNCMAMIDDIAAYAVRIQKVVSYFDPDGAAKINTDPKLVDGIKTFLTALAQPSADKTTLTYPIISDGGMGITISGKRPDEAITLFRADVTPFLQQTAVNVQVVPAAAPAQGMPAAQMAPAPTAPTMMP